MPDNNVLWTATDVPLPQPVWNRLKTLGFRVVLAERNGNILDRIAELSPRLWVGLLRENTSRDFALLRTIREKYPELAVLLFSRDPKVEQAVEAIKVGASDFLPASVSEEHLWAVLEGVLRSPGPLRRRGRACRRIEPGGFEPIAVNPVMISLLGMARKIAPRRSTVLVEGESGTGKEVVARYIHQQSDRNKGPFIAVNCAALPETLLESELFGHEKGAFTGAVTKKAGKFELADGGSLLLDEISEIAPSLQAKLLRVLQEGEIDRVGGQSVTPIDVRVIATTNRNLEEEVEMGNFRLDLFYRLNVVPIKIPPLRQRAEDIGPLAEFFLKKHGELNDETPKGLSPEALEVLKQQEWRGNVRELENLMERATLLVDSATLTPDDLAALCFSSRQKDNKPDIRSMQPLREMEKKMIFQALDENRGNRTHAAKILGISVRTLRNKLNEYKEGQKSASKT
jgi:DNA-binding NtrC family response regulator